MEAASGELVEGVVVVDRLAPLKGNRRTVPAAGVPMPSGTFMGRLDLLDDLLRRVEADNAARPHASVTIVFLGDLIDRGPQSAQVVERLRRYRPAFAKAVFLMGNHEEVLLRILSGETTLLADWLRFGGAECARSYGIDPKQMETLGGASALELLRDAIPKEHATFLASFVDTASFGKYLFVHAGIRPAFPCRTSSRRTCAGSACRSSTMKRIMVASSCTAIRSPRPWTNARTASAWTPELIGRGCLPHWV
jgi:hypothetical protein